MVMTETNMLGVNSWVDNTQDLEQQQREISEKLRFSRTMEQRQRILTLQSQMKDERTRLIELKAVSLQTDAMVIPRVKELELEIKQLKEKAFSDFNATLNCEDGIKAMNRESNAIEKQIRESKEVG
jgi:polynucleotide 5'-kinase involved in rRNA processing